jgi:hypothetical protein
MDGDQVAVGVEELAVLLVQSGGADAGHERRAESSVRGVPVEHVGHGFLPPGSSVGEPGHRPHVPEDASMRSASATVTGSSKPRMATCGRRPISV